MAKRKDKNENNTQEQTEVLTRQAVVAEGITAVENNSSEAAVVESKNVKEETQQIVNKEEKKAMAAAKKYYCAEYGTTPTNNKKYPMEALKTSWTRTCVNEAKREFYGETEAEVAGLHEISKDAFDKAFEKFGK